ncbi:Serpin E3 [Manis pentadactyla]|nr:Serpin E3 [Manis pentadactyla]
MSGSDGVYEEQQVTEAPLEHSVTDGRPTGSIAIYLISRINLNTPLKPLFSANHEKMSRFCKPKLGEPQRASTAGPSEGTQSIMLAAFTLEPPP